MPDIASDDNFRQRLQAVEQERDTAFTERDTAFSERDEYKRLYVTMLETCRRLEAGLVGQKRERHVSNSEQLALDVVSMLVTPPVEAVETVTTVEAHQRAKPTGRKVISDKLPRILIEVFPTEVQRQGLDAFDKIGEDTCETLEKRPASVVVVRTVRGKYVSKEKVDALKVGESTPVLQASPLELPIPRGLAGPGLLADSIVKRWVEHQPLHRMERTYGREGFEVSRSTLCGWHERIALLAAPLVIAMWEDALRNSPYLCADATGVLVQDIEKCRKAHFFVVVAPTRHVLFGYTAKHDSKAVDRLLEGFEGTLVADAHAVYNHLYESGEVVEAGCWAHTRRYFFKALSSDAVRANHALECIRKLFAFERQWATSPPEVRLKSRQQQAQPLVDEFFAWADVEALRVLDAAPISKAIQYARNQRVALTQFLNDGRLPIDNNISERALRRQAVGRKNWLFVGSDDGGRVNATLVSLLASCEMHGVEPYAYLRDLLCLLPNWPRTKVLELAPAYWRDTMDEPEVAALLEANVYRQVVLGDLK